MTINLKEPIKIPAKWTSKEENDFLNELAVHLLGHTKDDAAMDVYEDLAFLKYVILYNKYKAQTKAGDTKIDFEFNLPRLFLWVASINHEDKKYFEAMSADTHVYVLNTLFRRYTPENMSRVRVDVLTRLYAINNEHLVDGLEKKWSHFVAASVSDK